MSDDRAGSSTLVISRSDHLDPEPTEQAPSGPSRSRSRRSWAFHLRVVVSGALLAGVCLVAAVILPAEVFAGLLALISVIFFCHRQLFSWKGLLVSLVCIIMFIPVRRFKVPIPLSFALEPYRVIMGVLILAIFISLLIDPRFSWRRTGFGSSIGLFLVALFCSFATNVPTLSERGLLLTSVASIFNYAFLFSVFFLTRILLDSERTVILVINLVTLGGAFVGASAAVERFSRFNIFLVFPRYLGLQSMSLDESLIRGGGERAFGSAQHPIALSVLLAMLIPLAIYQARHSVWPSSSNVRRVFWVGSAMAMMIGIICTVSRTSFVVLGIMAVVAVIARPRLLRQLILVGVPAALVTSLVAPAVVLGTIKSFISPAQLIQSQYASAGWTGSGRLADLGPNITLGLTHPFFGAGVGSRIVVGPTANALILDDQLLDTFVESGLVGILGIVLLILLPAIRLWVFSRSPITPSRYTDLAVALLTAMVGYFASLFFFDGFGFLQTVMVFSILLAIGGWLMTQIPFSRRERRRRSAVRTPAKGPVATIPRQRTSPDRPLIPRTRGRSAASQ